MHNDVDQDEVTESEERRGEQHAQQGNQYKLGNVMYI